MDPQQLRTTDVPIWVLVAMGLVLLFIGYKAAKVLLKLFVVLLVLALIAGVIWWYLHPQ